MRLAIAICLAVAAPLGPLVHAADLPQNCRDVVFQDCVASGADDKMLRCDLDLVLVQQDVNTHIYGCETRLTAMSAILEIEVVAMRNQGGLALYNFKFNRDIEGRSQLGFGFGRPTEETEPLSPRAYITVIGVR